jgi:hypothetical protein
MKQITKQTQHGYEWKQRVDFEDIETLTYYLDRRGAMFVQKGRNVFANVDDVVAANAEYVKDVNESRQDLNRYRL